MFLHACRAKRRIEQAMSEAPEGLHVDERRLAAILAADVAGYSRLMGRNEEETVRELDAHQLTLSPRDRNPFQTPDDCKYRRSQDQNSPSVISPSHAPGENRNVRAAKNGVFLAEEPVDKPT